MELSPIEEPTPMDVEETNPVEESEAATETTPKKRKKKKASYKSMMANMTKPQTPSKDIDMEKESLRKVVGGGVFQKIERI
jgi:predicted ATP-dependent serine protease